MEEVRITALIESKPKGDWYKQKSRFGVENKEDLACISDIVTVPK